MGGGGSKCDTKCEREKAENAAARERELIKITEYYKNYATSVYSIQDEIYHYNAEYSKLINKPQYYDSILNQWHFRSDKPYVDNLKTSIDNYNRINTSITSTMNSTIFNQRNAFETWEKNQIIENKNSELSERNNIMSNDTKILR
jgi:hypothetical protein